MTHYKVAHLTSVHPRYDTRIFIKMCCSLAQSGFDTHLVVADGQGDEVKRGIQLHDVGELKGNRLSRMFKGTYGVYKKARALKADIYHFHDPELMPVGVLLKISGAKVIYDVHEDLPRQIMRKPWIAKPLQSAVAYIAKLAEYITAKAVDHVITVTPLIAQRFSHTAVTEVRNYPVITEFSVPLDDIKRERITYIGGISEERGIKAMIGAFAGSDFKFSLAGKFQPESLLKCCEKLPGWENVEFLGWQDRNGIRQLLHESGIGLVLLQPTGDYEDAYPVKMFEYMASGMAIIASDFPLWREIIVKNEVGLCVDPKNPKAIASAIKQLVENTALRQKMAARGLAAVSNTYNWHAEEIKLLSVYQRLMCES